MIGWQLFTTGLALAGSAALVPTVSGQPVPDPAVEVMEVASEPYRRMTVLVSIQDNGPYRFLIDTGAQSTVLSRDLADRLQLDDRRSATLVGTASRRTVETAPVEGLRLGSRSVNIPTAPLVEAAHIGGADGVLGLDSLQGQRVLLDFRDKLIHVADARELGGNKGYEIVVRAKRKLGQLIIARARLDGVPVSVIVDTGAQGSTGNLALLKALRRMQEVGTGTMTDINGVSVTATMRMARKLSLDRVQLENLPVLFTESPAFHSLGLEEEPALILGMQELRLFDRVAIDFETRRVLFDLPEPKGFAGALVSRRD